MAKSTYVYVSYIRTTPEKLWSALTDPKFIEQYWFGMRAESAFTAGSRAHIALRAGVALLVAVVVIAIPFNSNPSVNGNLTLVMSYAVTSMGLAGGWATGFGSVMSPTLAQSRCAGKYWACEVLVVTSRIRSGWRDPE